MNRTGRAVAGELPGDGLVRDAQVVVTRATVLAAPPERVWPWLVQVGWHRGGWYTARWVDRLLFPANRPSATRIRPELQSLAVGDFVPDGPPETGCGFVVEELVPGRHLVLRSTTHLPKRWRDKGIAAAEWSWSFTLTPVPGNRTRLVFRWRLHARPWWLVAAVRGLVVPADVLMSWSMLRGLRRRAGEPAVVDRLTAQDVSMLWPDELGWPQDIGVLGIVDGRALVDHSGRFDVDRVRRAVRSRLPLVPRFGQVVHTPRTGLGRPVWVDVASVDLAHHVRVDDVPGGDDGLLDAVERLRRHPLDRSRPLWEICCLTGLREGRIGFYLRAHHVITDGLGGVAKLAALLGPAADIAAPAVRPAPSARDLLADNVRARGAGLTHIGAAALHPARAARRLREAWPALRDTLTARAPRIELNRPLGTHRTLRTASAGLAEVTAAAHAHHATVNDVLLAAIAGGLRDLLLARGDPVDDLPPRAYVPVALHREETGPERGNADGLMIVPLPTATTDVAERLRRIAPDTARRRRIAHPSTGFVLRSGAIQRALLPLMADQRWANTYVANVPGPTRPLSFAGAPVSELYPIAPLLGNVTLGVAALSYAGRFTITVIADPDAVPDVDTFTTGLRRDLDALCREVGQRQD